MDLLRGMGNIVYLLVISLGLALLGWMLASQWALASFFAEPARVAFAGLVVLQALARAYVALRAPWTATGGIDSYQVGLDHWQLVAFESVMVLAPFCDQRDLGTFPDSTPLRYAGLVLYALGQAWTLWTILAPGRPYGVQGEVPPDRRLTRAGPYRLIRHPRYIGSLLWTLGVALIFRAWTGVFIVALLAVIILRRIREVEAAWEEAFGNDWVGYCEHTWRLIPWVY